MDFSASDVGFVSTMAGHYVQNTGEEDLVFLELFVAPEFQDISLNKWLRGLPRQAATAHTNLKAEDIEKIPAAGEPILR
jgi:oxalate decarboxylase